MKPVIKNIDEIVKRYLPSASEDRIDAGTARVQTELRSQPQHGHDRTIRPVSTRTFAWRRIFLVAAAAAVLLTVFVVPIVWRQYRSPGVLESAESSRRIDYGEVVRANTGTGAQVQLADGSRIEMRSGSELSLERADDGVRIHLNKGDVIVSAARQHGHLYVQTKDMIVSVVGTVFLVKAEAEGSRVAVIEGEVRVRHGEAEQSLRTGEQVKTNPKMEAQPVNEEISWSKNLVDHLALLEQAAAVSTARQNPPEAQLAFEEASIRPHRAANGDGRGGGGGSNMSPFGPGCAAVKPQIDPRRFAVADTTVWNLITWAYGASFYISGCEDLTPLNFISGVPGWVKSDKWDIEAVVPQGGLNSTDIPNFSSRSDRVPKLQKMIQNLLEDRFKLVVRREMKEVSAYALTMPGTLKTTYPASFDDPRNKPYWEARPAGSTSVELGAFSGKDAHMMDLALLLSRAIGRPVVDQTGFTGTFTFFIESRPFDNGMPYSHANDPKLAGLPTIFKAVESQVGLRLEETKTTVEFWKIERIEKPSEN